MPCWETRSVTVDLKVANADILTEALIALNINPLRNPLFVEEIIIEGKITWMETTQERAQEITRKIKQEYSRQSALVAARKYGWRISQKSPSKMTVTRRAF